MFVIDLIRELKRFYPYDEIGIAALKKMSTHVFSIGDTVSWAHETVNGSRISLSVRTGKIMSIKKNLAVCKIRNGRRYLLAISELSPVGAKTELLKL